MNALAPSSQPDIELPRCGRCSLATFACRCDRALQMCDGNPRETIGALMLANGMQAAEIASLKSQVEGLRKALRDLTDDATELADVLRDAKRRFIACHPKALDVTEELLCEIDRVENRLRHPAPVSQADGAAQATPEPPAKIRHRGVFIERQRTGGVYRYICHTGIFKFLPDLYDTQAGAIKAVDAKLDAASSVPSADREGK